MARIPDSWAAGRWDVPLAAMRRRGLLLADRALPPLDTTALWGRRRRQASRAKQGTAAQVGPATNKKLGHESHAQAPARAPRPPQRPLAPFRTGQATTAIANHATGSLPAPAAPGVIMRSVSPSRLSKLSQSTSSGFTRAPFLHRRHHALHRDQLRRYQAHL